MNTLLKFRRAALLVAIILLSGPGGLARASDNEPYPRILVTGQGSVDVAPDMAVLVLTVTREAPTARAALTANSSAMSDVFDAMGAQGIAQRDLQTSNFSIQPKYVYPPRQPSGAGEPPRLVGYRVRNSLRVRVRDISRVGAVLDEAVTLGVNEGGSILFTNDDTTAPMAQARVEAMQDAIARAKTLAGAAAVKTGKVLEISEQSFIPRPMPMARAEMSMSRAADAVPVASGENTIKSR